MSQLLSRHHAPDKQGCIQRITPQRAGWQYVGFEVFQLAAEQTLLLPVTDNERCLVLLGGKATVVTPGECFENIGDRMDPFERRKPYAVYVTAGESITVTAHTALELAVCSAPGQGTYPTRLIAPPDIDAEQRGYGNNRRYVHNILPENNAADSLLVVEVYTDEGCTSSYPSHKHDQDNPPHETYLEETYYHRLNPPQGFCMQRVYTDDRSLDESMAVYDRDVVMVPKGYHPVATIAGYDSYYLNVMAGPVREWRFSWEGAHQWINSAEYAQKHPAA
ncbi:5-deoxyglucuronate isomerase|uniref:5-deoxyglucuronate isomerase n=1 Tax=Brenneria salicis ATCC 15712 = DSM 30166 TaxID=714314 RepID=A0A366I2I9_9GAMM|nr:5-deoxy-glucuronate isomerase [Brenneria salicis]NMN92089.1 5-deoxyglucuronate isomerase [Brenneria salicis ATCC 15712 = DSM 30166]RBP61160.1 5-deoxyglucuronate isomerase [Brenneria salicis ATCC 15712 = DSM 30166]RLM30185.1 5-deoxy-glucuronate isomerase [Brenneria salicis ATCC 15712 = DSM 30166]